MTRNEQGGGACISQDGFRRYLKPYVEKKIPFLAYWHPKGFGLVRLDEVQVPSIPHIELHYSCPHIPLKPHRLTKRGRKAWEKNLERLRRQCCGPVITVEFDGMEIKSEEDFEL